MTSLGVVVLHFGCMEDTKRCLRSLASFCPRPAKICIVDNQTRGSIDLNQLFSSYELEILVKVCMENTGFARGVNIGAEILISEGCDYLFLLNNDAYLVDDSLTRACNLLTTRGEIGVVGIVNFFDSNCREIWQTGATRGRVLPRFYMQSHVVDEGYTLCDYVPGSALLTRTSTFKLLDGLDAAYFAYYEEIDYCLRLAQLDLSVCFLNDSRVVHSVGSASSSLLKTYLKTRNKLYLFKNHTDGIWKYRFIFIFIVALQLGRSLFYPRQVAAVSKGVFDFLRGRMGKPNAGFFA